MTLDKRREILKMLDHDRQAMVMPGSTWVVERGLIREMMNGGKVGLIAYSRCPEVELDEIIRGELEKARSAGYELEWKLYGHDLPENLAQRLTAAGLSPGEREAFMVFSATPESLSRFGPGGGDVRRVTDEKGLQDIQLIVEEVHGRSQAERVEQWRETLEQHPESMSLFAAYMDGEPAACGRIYYSQGSRMAGLYGGQTRERFRKRGLFTGLVRARLQEALERGFLTISVDALPTSEPILRKRGFEIVTYTQPFCFPG